MNELMILGICIMILGLIVSIGLYYKICYKNKNRHAYVRFLLFILLMAFTLLGGFFSQLGADKSRLEFTVNELALINSDKLFADFSDEDKQLFATIQFRYISNEEEKMTMYHDRILNLAIDEYLFQNSHRTDLTREDAEAFILKNWKEKIDFNKRKSANR